MHHDKFSDKLSFSSNDMGLKYELVQWFLLLFRMMTLEKVSVTVCSESMRKIQMVLMVDMDLSPATIGKKFLRFVI